MKKLMLVLAASFLVAASFAFSTGNFQVKSPDPVFYWFTTSGIFTGRTETRLDEVPLSDCPDEGILHCEYGYSDADLNVPGNPAMGLKTAATIDEIIYKEVE